MKIKNILILVVAIIVIQTSCVSNNSEISSVVFGPPSTGDIYLYGEMHSVQKILNKELELWSDYYNNQNMRHLFIELPYYTAEFLNLWMISDNDAILDELYEDWEGSVSYNIIVKEYYKKIKEQLPETLFHGTDVGHQRRSTGQRYLRYLRENDLMNTEQYELTLEAIEQGKFFYNHSDDEYRENKMVENFIREFDKLEDKSVMGIYGSAHTGLDSLNHTDDVLNMATQLSLRYGVKLSSEDLSPYSLITDPLRVDTILIEGVEYTASYFGRHDLPGFKDYSYREFWRLEYAWEDFSGNSKAHDVLPYNNYPMMIEIGQVFIIDYTKTDGTIVRKFYRADGNEWKGMAVTEEIKLN